MTQLTTQRQPAHGGAASALRVAAATGWTLVHTAAIGASVYHGYKRNDSVPWALAWGLGGLVVPIVMVPIAIAQGFGKRKRGR